jgi:hypothetical protein
MAFMGQNSFTDKFAGLKSFRAYDGTSRLGVPRLLLARMLMNVVIEGTVGAIPLAGDAFDVFFRANRRNVALLREHFAKSGYR